MQFGMQFWCELAASAMAAGLVYMGLGLFLSGGEEDFDPDSVLSANQAVPDEQAPSDEGGVLDFLREAVCLAEERLKAQEEHSRALERKATLPGALCVCVCVPSRFCWPEDSIRPAHCQSNGLRLSCLSFRRRVVVACKALTPAAFVLYLRA